MATEAAAIVTGINKICTEINSGKITKYVLHDFKENIDNNFHKIDINLVKLLTDQDNINNNMQLNNDKFELLHEIDKNLLNVNHDFDKKLLNVKHDINDLKMGLTELKIEMTEFKTELKTDIAELKTELKTEMTELKTELKTDMTVIKNLLVQILQKN